MNFRTVALPFNPHPGILRMLAPLPQGEGLKNTVGCSVANFQTAA
jgi:hypothetical protein